MLAAIAAANEAEVAPYGDDPWSWKLERVFADVFDQEVRVFTVATGRAFS